MPSSFRPLVSDQRRGRCNAMMLALTPTPVPFRFDCSAGKEKFTGPLTHLMPLDIMPCHVSVRLPLLDGGESKGGRTARKAKTVCLVVVR